MSDERTRPEQLLVIAYQYIHPITYGSIAIVDPETYARAAAHSDVINLENWSAPYFIAKHLNGRDIVYGSIPYLIGEAAKPIFRLNHRLDSLKDLLPPEVRQAIRATHESNSVVFSASGVDFPDWFMHRQEELMKEALLLSGLHLRTLLEVFSDKGRRSIPTYDHEGNPNTVATGEFEGAVTLHRLCNMMMHHRYLVVSDGHVRDIFSDKKELESAGLFGSKLNLSELFHAVLASLTEITVNNFVGALRGRLVRLSADSSPREIMLATQNVHALNQIIADRIGDPRFGTLQNFLFSELTDSEKRQIGAAKGEDEVRVVRHFTPPKFKVAERVDQSGLKMSVKINGKQEMFDIDQAQFFDALTGAFGDDPLVSLDWLIDLYNKPEIDVLA